MILQYVSTLELIRRKESVTKAITCRKICWIEVINYSGKNNNWFQFFSLCIRRNKGIEIILE